MTAQEMGRKGGAARSELKVATSRENVKAARAIRIARVIAFGDREDEYEPVVVLPAESQVSPPVAYRCWIDRIPKVLLAQVQLCAEEGKCMKFDTLTKYRNWVKRGKHLMKAAALAPTGSSDEGDVESYAAMVPDCEPTE